MHFAIFQAKNQKTLQKYAISMPIISFFSFFFNTFFDFLQNGRIFLYYFIMEEISKVFKIA